MVKTWTDSAVMSCRRVRPAVKDGQTFPKAARIFIGALPQRPSTIQLSRRLPIVRRDVCHCSSQVVGHPESDLGGRIKVLKFQA